MEILSNHEEYLIYAKFTDSLSPDEEVQLNELLRTNERAKEIYGRLLKKLPHEEVNSSFDRIRHSEKWQDVQDVMTGPQKIRRRVIYRKLVIAAAALLVFSTGIWLFLSNRHTQGSMPVVQLSKNIELILASGEKINLSTSKGSISHGEVHINNSGTSLTYDAQQKAVSGHNQLVVPTGMDYQITLSDNSKIWLNAATKLDFPFNFAGNSREISIDGEAYLEVSPDADRPFIVHLPKSSIQVLGTSFNVNSNEKEIEKVALVEGMVLMKAGSGEIKLEPGKLGILSADGDLRKEDFDASKVLAWREGLFYFSNASVIEISEVLPRWFGIEVHVDNNKIEHRRFTGVVDKNEPIRIFQNNLKEISGIETYVDENNVLHFK